MSHHSILITPESQVLSYEYVRSEEKAWELLAKLDKNKVYGLDFETTSLSPLEGSIRLTSIAGYGVNFILDHMYCGPFKDYAEAIAMRTWAVFNACFEGAWIDHAAAPDVLVQLHDVQHLKRAKLGGRPLSLARMAKDDLDIILFKDEQQSNWSAKELTQEQLDYAVKDAIVTDRLYHYWLEELTPEQLNGFYVLNNSWRGTVEMQQTGLRLDIRYHEKLLKWWTLKRDTALNYAMKWTPPPIIMNINSNKQLSEFLGRELDHKTLALWPVTGKRGDLCLDRAMLTQAAYRMPYPMNRWMASVIILRKMNKYISTYGEKLIHAQKVTGKITSRFNIAQAITGRYSSSSFNLQNIPRNPVVRRSFTSKYFPSTGETRMVIADYSSIEVRVLAELAGDERLLHDAIYGDVHSRSASQIFGIDFDHFSAILHSDDPKYASLKLAYKSLRSRAKAFTFQLLYGAGSAALAVVLKTSDEEAYKAIDAWATLYPKAYHYRQLMYEKMMYNGYLPVADGRTIYVPKLDRSMPVAANYPVQGAAASVMYRAVYHTNLDLMDSILNAWMAASVHDELVLFARECWDEAAELLVKAMIKGWLDIFPSTDTNNLVGEGNKASVGWHWGMKG